MTPHFSGGPCTWRKGKVSARCGVRSGRDGSVAATRARQTELSHEVALGAQTAGHCNEARTPGARALRKRLTGCDWPQSPRARHLQRKSMRQLILVAVLQHGAGSGMVLKAARASCHRQAVPRLSRQHTLNIHMVSFRLHRLLETRAHGGAARPRDVPRCSR